jgi:hypothetical protein
MKKNNLFLKLTLFVFVLISAGVFNESQAQRILSQQRPGKSNPDVFFPNRKRPTPIFRKGNPPIIVRNGRVNNLPPGQQKKIYGSRSARDYAPGRQNKNRYDNDRRYNNGGGKKWNKERENEHGDNGHRNNGHGGNKHHDD